MSAFTEKLIRFYSSLEITDKLPEGVEILNPYGSDEVMKLLKQFIRKFYSTEQPRRILLGINPGRFGAGITGITFTDPVALKDHCGIMNTFEPKAELSSRFVYEVILAYGGAEKFYSFFFLSAVCPLGFVKNGKNLNYYDEKPLESALEGFITGTLTSQLNLGIRRDIAYSMGEGKNYQYLLRVNRELKLFKEIIPLPHPRWVMQYRYKRREEFIDRYIKALEIP